MYFKKNTANKNPDTRRLFIAIKLPDDVKKYLYLEAMRFYGSDVRIKIINFKNMHITLKFIGDVKASSIEGLQIAISRAMSGFKKFYFSIGARFGAFPNSSAARILYVPVSNDANNIESIFTKLEQELAEINIKKEKRKFESHITVARIKNEKNIKGLIDRSVIARTGIDKSILCKSVTLFESHLKTTGPEYIIIDDFELK